MALTAKSAYALTEILIADPERAKRLLGLEADEATIQINALGHSFSIEDIEEYGRSIRSSTHDELSNDALDLIPGGICVDIEQINVNFIKW